MTSAGQLRRKWKKAKRDVARRSSTHNERVAAMGVARAYPVPNVKVVNDGKSA